MPKKDLEEELIELGERVGVLEKKPTDSAIENILVRLDAAESKLKALEEKCKKFRT